MESSFFFQRGVLAYFQVPTSDWDENASIARRGLVKDDKSCKYIEAPIVAVGALNKKDTPDWNCSTARGGLNEVLHMGSAVVMKCGVRSEVCVYADKLN